MFWQAVLGFTSDIFGLLYRYCTIQPRFPFGNAAPTLWMICYRNPNEAQPVCRIPLSNARVMVEGPQDSSNGIIVSVSHPAYCGLRVTTDVHGSASIPVIE